MQIVTTSLSILAFISITPKSSDAFVFPHSVQGHLAPTGRRSATTFTRLAREISEDERSKARAALVDSPELNDLVSMLNKLRGFETGGEEGEPEKTFEGDPPLAEEVATSAREENVEDELTEQQSLNQVDTPPSPKITQGLSESRGQDTPATAVLAEEEAVEEEADEKGGLGAGGMADTRDPDEMDHEDPRKSVSAAPSFEEYMKMRQSS